MRVGKKKRLTEIKQEGCDKEEWTRKVITFKNKTNGWYSEAME